MSAGRILISDHDRTWRSGLSHALAEDGLRVTTLRPTVAVAAILKSSRFGDVVVIGERRRRPSRVPQDQRRSPDAASQAAVLLLVNEPVGDAAAAAYREAGVTDIITRASGIPRAAAIIRDHLFGGRRTAARLFVDLPTELGAGDVKVSARLLDVSLTGAGVRVEAADARGRLAIGDRVRLHLDAGAAVDAVIRRRLDLRRFFVRVGVTLGLQFLQESTADAEAFDGWMARLRAGRIGPP
jgi:hypothetical protein